MIEYTKKVTKTDLELIIDIYRLIINFVYQIDGYVSLITVLYCLFKSLPVKEQRLLPTITPSGFNIGTNLNMNFSRNSFAGPVSLVRKSKKPFIIHDDGDSPGCTLAVITMARFFYKNYLKIATSLQLIFIRLLYFLLALVAT